jgi:hypothetical protein
MRDVDDLKLQRRATMSLVLRKKIKDHIYFSMIDETGRPWALTKSTNQLTLDTTGKSP